VLRATAAAAAAAGCLLWRCSRTEGPRALSWFQWACCALEGAKGSALAAFPRQRVVESSNRRIVELSGRVPSVARRKSAGPHESPIFRETQAGLVEAVDPRPFFRA
jgi:hypothetical protein